jgi:hypothetical protein
LTPNRGYAVASDLLDELLAQLDAAGVPYQVTREDAPPR